MLFPINAMITSELHPATKIKVSSIRVLLIDPQSLMRNGLQAMLEMESDLQIVGSLANAESAIAQLQVLQPDIVLIDSIDGWSAIAAILSQLPSTKVLALSTYERDADILQAMQAGAKGYLLKNMPVSELVKAIRLVYGGYSQMAPGLMEKLLTNLPTSVSQPEFEEVLLTSRDRDILRLIGQGCTNREIAFELHLAEGTVKTYVTRLLSRLSLRNRSQLAIYATSILL
ncbi:MAG: response regulator transcription factor [Leptolyngbya sp. Prado105]|jgi:DNA-binding NarL/FixJ family response regulator|nr:response regulator transcription factor [Leptolyngbya sp. Prado105]